LKLNYKDFGEGKPLVILHGLFGSLDNWLSLSKNFSEKHHVYLIDARNHGQSPHCDTHTYIEMAEDLFDFFQEHELKDAVVIGHSMGGKTAMVFAAKHSDLLQKLIVVDMGVKQYPVHHDLIIRSMQALDVDNLTSRKEAEQFLERMLDEGVGVVQFLLKNIYRRRSEDGSAKYAWRFNLDVIADEIDEMGMPIAVGSEIPTLFIHGTQSYYVLEQDKPEILSLFPNTTFAPLNTSHWVHAEDPKGFVKSVKDFTEE